MDEVVAAADRGMPVLGICNGFQILCEAGLLPGALTRNAGLHFVCRDLALRVESAATAWTASFAAGQEIVVPLKSGEGRYVADAATLAQLEADGRVVFRYVDPAPERVDGRHRRDRLGERPRRGPDAAPRARDRPADRPLGGRPRPVHLGARRGRIGLTS